MNRAHTILLGICMTILLNGPVAAAGLEPGGADMAPQRGAEVSTTTGDAERQGVASWEKERALYLRDLKLASLDQRELQLSESQYLQAEQLIQAQLNVAYAETDLITLGDYHTAMVDLHDALTNLAVASDHASAADRDRIANIEHQLDSSVDSSTRLCKTGDDGTNVFGQISSQIDLLIQDVS